MTESNVIPANNEQIILSALRKEAERLEEDSTYSGKSHLNAAISWKRYSKCLGIPSVILAALAGTTLVKNCPDAASSCALAAALLTALATFLKPNEKAAQHRAAGEQYLSLRNQTRFFRTVDMSQTTDMEGLTSKLREFCLLRDKLNSTCPGIPRRAFEAARKGIEQGESTYKTDTEDK